MITFKLKNVLSPKTTLGLGILAAITSISATSTYAKSAPNYNSLRALSMGGAHVAVADDYNTIYYNPAGLNNINKIGNYEKRPDLGYYRKNTGDMKLGLQGISPDVINIGSDILDFYNSHKQTFEEIGGPNGEQALADDSTLYQDAQFLDGITVPLGIGYEMAMAWHNFGAAFWIQSETVPEFDTGILLPEIKMTNTYVAAVGQLQTAYEIDPELSIGIGYRMVKYVEVKEVSIDIETFSEYQESPSTLWDEPEIDEAVAEIQDRPFEVDHGIDLGALYQYSREVRFGGSLTNIFITGINGQDITPNLTVGAVYSPRKWQKNTLHGRKLNFAIDFADLLENERNYKPFSKINFGTEIEWTLLALPYVDLELLDMRLAGGFKGGYWTAGAGLKAFRFFQLAVATWAEEDGYFTGQSPNRRFSGEFSIGF